MLRTLDRRYWHRFGISIVNFKYISYPVLVPLLCFLFLVILFPNLPRSYFRNEHWSIFLKSCSSKLDKIREIIESWVFILISWHASPLALLNMKQIAVITLEVIMQLFVRKVLVRISFPLLFCIVASQIKYMQS